MKAVLLQSDIKWADPKVNHEHLHTLMDQAPKADLFVFPEMFSTGFATDPQGIAEESPYPSLSFMQKEAAERDAAVAGSVSIRENDSFRNRFYFVFPDGSYEYYDKHHLFTYSAENDFFTAGKERKVVSWRGARILLLVCYDIRFPIWCRLRDDYDVIIAVASWPDVRMTAWNCLNRARAVENLSYMICVNRVGSDPSCNYIGGTMAINPYGEVVSSVKDGKEGFAVADIDMDFVNTYRGKFPAADDADQFELV